MESLSTLKYEAGAANKYSQSMNYEQGSEAGTMLFVLNCNNIPVGSVIEFNCPEQGPRPQINLPPTVVSAATSFAAGMMANVPANFKGKINYSLTFTQPLPPEARLTMQAALPLDPNGYHWNG